MQNTTSSPRYVNLTTYRDDGSPVHTPMWTTRTPDGAWLMMTGRKRAKVTRVRNNPRVAITPCDFKGTLRSDAATVVGDAKILDGPEADTAIKAICADYGGSRIWPRVAKIVGSVRPNSIGKYLAIQISTGDSNTSRAYCSRAAAW